MGAGWWGGELVAGLAAEGTGTYEVITGRVLGMGRRRIWREGGHGARVVMAGVHGKGSWDRGRISRVGGAGAIERYWLGMGLISFAA